MRHARASAVVLALALLAGCRGGLPQSAVPQTQQFVRAAIPAAAVRLVPIGPTHMTSGFIPNSGKVNAYAADPNDPKIIYAASGRGTGLETYSSAGIFRTTDGGKSWQAIDAGLTDPSGITTSVVNSLWLDPSHPNVLLAATEYDGLFQTIDGGSSWHNVYRTTQATQFAVFENRLYATSAKGILVSRNDGATWNLSARGDASAYPTALAALESSSGSAFVAGYSDGSIFDFNGGRWQRAGRLPFDPHTGTDGSSPAVHQLAIDPTQPSLVYASQNDGRWDQNLNASKDNGKTWAKVVPHAQCSYYCLGLGTQAIAFSQVHPHMLYVGLDGGLVYFTADGSQRPAFQGYVRTSVIDIRNVWTIPNGKDDRCWIASDQGLDMVQSCTNPSRVPLDDVASKTTATGLARRFAISPNGRTIVVSLQDFDSHATFDGGAVWREETSKSFSLYEDGFNELQPGDPRTCYAFDESSGFLVSHDGCRTYASPSRKAMGLFPSRLMTTPLAFDPKNPIRLYLVSGSIVGAGFAPAPQAVFTTTDQGKTFIRLPWPVNEPGMIAVDPNNGRHIIVGDLAKQRFSSMLVTFDGGRTWKHSAGVPVTAFWYSATISPSNGNIVLASSVDAANNVFVLRSTDGGLTFRKTATVANAPLLRGRIDRDLLQRVPEPPAFVYSPARQILFDRTASKTPYAVVTTLRGAFLSTDLGSTWTRIDRDLIAHSFWGIRWNNGYLYLGSDGQGIVKSTQPLQ